MSFHPGNSPFTTTLSLPQQDSKFAATAADVSCCVLSVRARPFAVPRGLLSGHGGSNTSTSLTASSAPAAAGTVSCQVADAPSNQTVSILVTKTQPLAEPALLLQQKQTLMQQQQQQQANSGSADGGGAGILGGTDMSARPHTPPGYIDGALLASQGFDVAALSTPTADSSSLIIQRVPLRDPIVVWRAARFLNLMSSISPRVAPNLLPLIAAYRHAGGGAGTAAATTTTTSFVLNATPTALNNTTTSQNNNSNSSSADPLNSLIDPAVAAVYIAQPHVCDTLAACARAAPTSAVQTPQLRTIAREILDALSILHKNSIVAMDLTPSTVRVNLALKTRADVAIALSRPVLANTPMPSQLFLRLLELPRYGHRYLAPEVIVQLQRASTSRAVAGAGSLLGPSVVNNSTSSGSGLLTSNLANTIDPAPFFALPDTSTISVSPAVDIWSLGCILVELVLGRPLFPSEHLFDHGKVVSQVLSSPFPDPSAASGSNSSVNPNPSRLGVFTGVPVSSALQTALAACEPNFRQLVAAMLQIEPSLRPTADDCIKSQFIAMGIAGNVAGARTHGIGGVFVAKVIGGGRRNSGTSSGSRPLVGAAGADQHRKSSPISRTAAGGGSVGGVAAAGGGNEAGASQSALEFGREWAVPEPGDAALEALMAAAPVMP